MISDQAEGQKYENETVCAEQHFALFRRCANLIAVQTPSSNERVVRPAQMLQLQYESALGKREVAVMSFFSRTSRFFAASLVLASQESCAVSLDGELFA